MHRPERKSAKPWLFVRALVDRWCRTGKNELAGTHLRDVATVAENHLLLSGAASDNAQCQGLFD